jgi:L-asparaginase II
MRVTNDRLFAKVGAEGFYCAAVPSMQVGVALKVEDGARRAAEPALLGVLHAIDVLSTSELDRLSVYSSPQIRNTRNEIVGSLRSLIEFA